MKEEADKLKRVAKVVAVGIGNRIDETELNDIASAPTDRNVIRVQNVSRLTDAVRQPLTYVEEKRLTDLEEQLRNATCTGQ